MDYSQRERGSRGGEKREEGLNKRTWMCCVHVPHPHKQCKCFVLNTSINKMNKMFSPQNNKVCELMDVLLDLIISYYIHISKCHITLHFTVIICQIKIKFKYFLSELNIKQMRIFAEI